MPVLLVASVIVDVLALAILVAPLRRRIAALKARMSLGPSHPQHAAGDAVPSPIADEKIERIDLRRLPVRRRAQREAGWSTEVMTHVIPSGRRRPRTPIRIEPRVHALDLPRSEVLTMDDKLSLRIDLRAFNGHQEVQTIVSRIEPEDLYALVTLADALVKRVGVLPGEKAFEVWKAAITAKCHALQATGQRIKQKRFLLGWSRRQLAGELKLSQAAIVSCERGRARSALLHQVESFLDAKRTKPRR